MQRKGGLIVKLALMCLLAISFLPAGCSQGGLVEGEVRYKYVTGMQDRRYYIIVRNEPGDGLPSIILDKEAPAEVRQCFAPQGNLIVDNATEDQIEVFYDRLYYMVTLHITSGSHYYNQAYRTERDIFNRMELGAKVKVDTEASDIGPRILRIIE
ncbi:MAG: hypothetical protein QUS33_09760 [Dehalococcoidia bacterium]|nr:hypothetical protein [Dehalococcoidia bacterium]